MIPKGDSLRDFIESLDPNYIRRELDYTPDDLTILQSKLEDLKSDKSKDGKALEDFVKAIFENINMHRVHMNKRTSTNELDLFMKSTDITRAYYEKTFPQLKDDFIIECKQYHKKIGVTWVNKFYSLLIHGKYKIGFLFSIDGITGRNAWDSARGSCSKVALKDEIYILNFDLRDMEMLCNGKNLIDLIEEKYIALKSDIAIQINSHENECFLL